MSSRHFLPLFIPILDISPPCTPSSLSSPCLLSRHSLFPLYVPFPSPLLCTSPRHLSLSVYVLLYHSVALPPSLPPSPLYISSSPSPTLSPSLFLSLSLSLSLSLPPSLPSLPTYLSPSLSLSLSLFLPPSLPRLPPLSLSLPPSLPPSLSLPLSLPPVTRFMYN